MISFPCNLQRDLEAAIMKSKLENNGETEAKNWAKESKLKETTEGKINENPEQNPKVVETKNSPSVNSSPSQHHSSSTNQTDGKPPGSSSPKDKPSTIKVVVKGESVDSSVLHVVKLEDIRPAADSSLYDDPVPSTSTGMTAKRQRKKVVFKEGKVPFIYLFLTCPLSRRSESKV